MVQREMGEQGLGVTAVGNNGGLLDGIGTPKSTDGASNVSDALVKEDLEVRVSYSINEITEGDDVDQGKLGVAVK